MKISIYIMVSFFFVQNVLLAQGYLRDDAVTNHTSGITINEVSAYSNPVDYNADGIVSGGDKDEFIELVNSSNIAININGWTIATAYEPDKDLFTFPDTSIAPGKALILFCRDIEGQITNFNPGQGNMVFSSGDNNFRLANYAHGDAVGLRNNDDLYISVFWIGLGDTGVVNSVFLLGPDSLLPPPTLVGTNVELDSNWYAGQSQSRNPEYTGTWSQHPTISGTVNWSQNNPTRTITDPNASPGRYYDEFPDNSAPQITSIAVTSATEDVLYQYQVTATDPNVGDVLTYSLSIAPTWLSINSGNGLISGTPANANVGDTTVTVVVTDLNESADSQTYTLTVINTNDPPIITSTAVTEATEDAFYEYQVVATDLDVGDVLTYSLSIAPSWLSINSGNGLISGTPTNANVGDTTVTVVVSDLDESTDSQIYTLTVTNTNDAPTITSTAVTQATEDVLYKYQVVATDLDVGDVLTYSLSVAPSWLSINSGNGLISGTPTNANVGDTTVTVVVSDLDESTDSQIYTLTVTNTNDAPTITSTAVTQATEDVLYEYQIVATDLDVGDILSYSLSVAPSWLGINSTTGLISGTPTNANVGDTTITVVVDDGQAGKASVSQTYTLTVTNVNDAPVITSTAVTSATEDVLYQYQVTATDDDVGDVLTYSLGVAPTWLSINSGNGLISGTPTNANVGDTTVTVVVTDLNESADSQTYTLTVINTNDPPTITSTAVTEATEDALYEYQVVATDLDVGDVLTYSLSVAPSWLSINSGNGLISGMPANANVGDTTVTVVVSDLNESRGSQTYTLTVTNTNDPPTITSTPVTSATEDVLYEYQVTTTDPDPGTVFIFSLSVNPSWLSINSSTGLVSGTPGNVDVGDTTVTVVVSDGVGKKTTDDQTYSLTVMNVNDPPVISADPELTFNEDDSLVYSISELYDYVSDPDHPDSVLTYILNIGNYITVTHDSPNVILKASANWFGSDTLELIVMDPELFADTAQIFITVNSVNDALVFINWPDTVQFINTSDTVLTMNDYVIDNDLPGDSLRWEFSTNNDTLILQFDLVTSELILTAPDYIGLVTLYCIVTDDSSASVTDLFYVEVNADPTGIEDFTNQIPDRYFLNQNYPNPFNPVTKIKYGLPKSGKVEIEVYNIIGQKVAKLLNEFKPAGYHEISFDGINLPSGVYFYRIQTKGFNNVKKMIFIK